MKMEDMKPDLSAGVTPLAIIGIGCLFPQAEDRESYWANIREGINAITDIPSTHWQIADYFDRDPKSPDMTYGRRGGFLSPVQFNPLEYNIPPNIIEAIDTTQLLGLVTAGQALRDAGYGPTRDYDRSRASVILGVTGALELVIPLGARLGHPAWRAALKEAGVVDDIAEDVVQRIADSYVSWQENSFPGLLGNVVAGRISKHYDLGGTNCVVDAACASSFSALHLAAMELATGKADMVVTGGIDTFNSIFMYMCFSKTPALSPTGDVRPFDAAGDGTILGEGLGILVIKRLSDAERDNDRIYAVIRGVGSSSDGKGEAIYAPSVSGQKKALLDAYVRANVTPLSLGLIEAHGTGTKVGDAVEVTALREVFGEAETPWCALGSVKSQIGHTKAAAGAAGLIKAALALHHKVLPPATKITKPLEEVTSNRTPFYLATEKRPWLPREGAPRRAGVSAFGFGGSNFHVVLEEYRSNREAIEWDGNVQILPFSGADIGTLHSALDSVPTEAPWNVLRGLASASRDAFRENATYRIALVIERERTNLAALVTNARTMLREKPKSAWSTPDGAFFACGDKPGKLAMLFPGQGSQYTGMLRDLACSFPQILDTLVAADEGFARPDGQRLSDIIFPSSTFADATKEAQEQALRATETAQPAIGAVSLGLYKLLQAFGVTPEALAGHSFGELTALCAAGRLNESSLHELSRLRGRLMGEGKGDKGGMLAVSASLAKVEQIIAEERLELVIANRNAPSQAVLSGSTDEISRAETAFSHRNLSCKQLVVSAAFHSPLVADAAAPFLKALENIELKEGEIPLYANTTAALYPVDTVSTKTLLAYQLAKPVDFVSEIEAMYAAGVHTFVEVGPGARLTGLVRAIVGDRPHTVLAVDASSGKRSGIADLARALAQLTVGGFGVRLPLWDAEYRPPENITRKPVMTVPICGANYVKPKPKRPPTATNRPVSTVPNTPKYESPAVVAPVNPNQPAGVSASPQSLSRETLTESLRLTRESMAMLQKMQEETAQLHRLFLEGQETAARTFQTLLEQQQRLIQGGVSPKAVNFTSHQSKAATISPACEISQREILSNQQSKVNSPSPTTGSVVATLLSVVSEKTGYPVEMLEMEMGMDSDLGIDSIKRVEILSAIREKLPEAPPIGPEHMGTLRTLAEIAAHLSAGSSTNTGSGSVFQSPVISLPTALSSVADILLSVVSEKTGYPVDMLEMEMGMDSDLGIDSIKRVEILSAIREKLPEAPPIGPEHMGTLRTLAEIAAHLSANTVSTAAVPVSDTETDPSHQAPVTATSSTPSIGRSAVIPVLLDERASSKTITLDDNGEFWVTDDGSPFAADLCAIIQGRGLNVRRICATEAHDIATPEKISGLVITAPLGGTDDHFLENAFLLLKNTAPALRRSAASGGALCATVSRLDGAFGCGSATSLIDPLSGGLAGLSKTAAKEWPEVTFRAIDLGEFPGSAAMARALAGELFRKGPLEVGLTPTGRTILELAELTAAPMPVSPSIDPGDVVIMTGGGRGVTAAAAIALTEAYCPLLILLGRSPEPAAEPIWLSALGEEAQIKRSIIEHAEGKLHPRDIEERYRAIIAGREIRATLDRIAAAGGQAIYRSVDIREGNAVRAIINEIRRNCGPVRGIVHGAGILADRLITDKSREQFALVYSTKVEGLRSLLSATKEDDLRFLAIFSSITSRFGRVGQVDYAVANEALNKLVQAEARRRPGCRAVSINWGPWDGGMVTPALKKVFAAEDIGLIGLKEGGEFLIREIAATDATVEIVAMAGATGNAKASSPHARPHSLAEAFSLTLTVDDYPFLRSHVLDGKAVLPMAVIVEWLAHGALHGNPGFRFHGFNDLRICKGVVFGHETSCALRVMAGRAEKRDTFYLVPVELSGTDHDGRAILHARAEIVLATRLPEGIRSIIEIPVTPYLLTNNELYDRERLFHGPELHGIEQVIGCSAKGIAALVKGAPPPAGWIRLPLRSIWITDPLALDSAFQLMILWSFERFGAGSLPCFAGRYRQFIDTFPREGVQVVIRVTAERKQSATADMEFLDRHTGKLVARLEDYECVIDPSLKKAFQRNQLAQPGPVQLGAA